MPDIADILRGNAGNIGDTDKQRFVFIQFLNDIYHILNIPKPFGFAEGYTPGPAPVHGHGGPGRSGNNGFAPGRTKRIYNIRNHRLAVYQDQWFLAEVEPAPFATCHDQRMHAASTSISCVFSSRVRTAMRMYSLSPNEVQSRTRMPFCARHVQRGATFLP